MKEELILTFQGKDDWSRPVYKDQNGVIWKDVELMSTNLDEGDAVDKSALCTSTGNSLDGEPNTPMSAMNKYADCTLVLVFEQKPPSKEDEFRYMMLSRMQMDCKAHIDNSPFYNSRVSNVALFIKEMKSMWNALPIKPEWLSFEQILDYEKQMSKI